MPVLCGLMVFGTVMWLLERRVNAGFKSQTAGIYYAFVSMSSFGFGDIVPATSLGRLLTIVWTIFSVFALSAISGTISSRLTVAQLSVSTIDNLSQVLPTEVCIEVRARGCRATRRRVRLRFRPRAQDSAATHRSRCFARAFRRTTCWSIT